MGRVDVDQDVVCPHVASAQASSGDADVQVGVGFGGEVVVHRFAFRFVVVRVVRPVGRVDLYQRGSDLYGLLA